MTRTARLFQLMQALRSGPSPKTSAQLAQDLGVSARTVHRDIDALRGLGAVIDGEAGFGFTLIEDATLPPLGFTDDELEALVLGLREAQLIGDPALSDAASTALRKLQGRLPQRQSHRLSHAVLTATRFDRPALPGIEVAALRKATWDERAIEFAYTDAKGDNTQRRVNPLSIVYMDRASVLLSWCHLRQDFRVFRLDRMQNMAVTDESFRPNRVPLLRAALDRIRADREAKRTRRHVLSVLRMTRITLYYSLSRNQEKIGMRKCIGGVMTAALWASIVQAESINNSTWPTIGVGARVQLASADVVVSIRPVLRPENKVQRVSAEGNARFQAWLGAFRDRALAQGVSPDTLARALAGLTYDRDVIDRDRNQAEFTKPIWDYLDAAVSDRRIADGSTALTLHADTLARIEAEYGVEKEVVTAIWGLETSFGGFRGSNQTIRSLATLAFDARRSQFFETQLVAALQILQAGDVSAASMIGSWAGCNGAYAVHANLVSGLRCGFRRRRTARYLVG